MHNADVFVCINVLIQHFYDWVAFNDTLPHTLVSWQSLSIMAQSFWMLFYMWEGNKMFCMSQIFLKHFQTLIQYTAWNRMDTISAYDELESYDLKVVSGDIVFLAIAAFPSDLPYFECCDHCSLRKWTQCNPYVFPSGSCQFVRASRCRFALTWRADDLTAPRPPPSPPYYHGCFIISTLVYNGSGGSEGQGSLHGSSAIWQCSARETRRDEEKSSPPPANPSPLLNTTTSGLPSLGPSYLA